MVSAPAFLSWAVDPGPALSPHPHYGYGHESFRLSLCPYTATLSTLLQLPGPPKGFLPTHHPPPTTPHPGANFLTELQHPTALTSWDIQDTGSKPQTLTSKASFEKVRDLPGRESGDPKCPLQDLPFSPGCCLLCPSPGELLVNPLLTLPHTGPPLTCRSALVHPSGVW